MLKSFWQISLITSIITSSATASDLTPATNLDLLKRQIINYHRSGAWEYELKKIADQAMAFLKKSVQENKQLKSPQKLAVVLDIDETCLSNYRDLKKLGFGGTAKMQNEAEGRADDPVIAPTLALYRYALKHKVRVFFVTGRLEKYRQSTIKNLKETGYTSVKSAVKPCENLPVNRRCLLYLRDRKNARNSAITYKTAMRKKITNAGYRIILNIGDQYSDLAGGYSVKSFKYPNYMYYIA